MSNGLFILQKYVEELKGDDHLFVVQDLRPGASGVPHIVTGFQAEGFARNGHYQIEYHGPNPTSGANLASKAAEQVRKELGMEIKMPKSAAELQAEVDALQAELAAEKKKSAKAAKAGKVDKGSDDFGPPPPPPPPENPDNGESTETGTQTEGGAA